MQPSLRELLKKRFEGIFEVDAYSRKVGYRLKDFIGYCNRRGASVWVLWVIGDKAGCFVHWD